MGEQEGRGGCCDTCRCRYATATSIGGSAITAPERYDAASRGKSSEISIACGEWFTTTVTTTQCPREVGECATPASRTCSCARWARGSAVAAPVATEHEHEQRE
jgi:hypothetical protein